MNRIIDVLVIFGKTLAGKGYLCRMLQEIIYLKFLSIESGELVREEKKRSTSGAEACRESDISGVLVPDAIINVLAYNRWKEIRNHLHDRMLIVDGFPRSKPQVGYLKSMLGANCRIQGLYLDAEDETCLERALDTRLSGDGTARQDDHQDIVRMKLEIFHEVTLPAIEVFSRRFNLCTLKVPYQPEKVLIPLLVDYLDLGKYIEFEKTDKGCVFHRHKEISIVGAEDDDRPISIGIPAGGTGMSSVIPR